MTGVQTCALPILICDSLIEELEPVTVNSCAVVYANYEDFGQLSMIPLYGHSANLANGANILVKMCGILT